MTDTELTKMLRSSANRVVNYAGDRIEALTAERDHAWEMAAKADTQMGQSLADNLQAKAERDEAWAYMSALQGDLYDAIMIKAERDSYRKALEDIIADFEPGYPLSHDAIKYAARAALKGETP